MPLRVLVDANLLISFLLAPHAVDRTVVAMMHRAWNGEYTLLMPEDLLDELGETLATKLYLRQHISAVQAQMFVEALREVAELLPPVLEAIPHVVRDPDDDYLLAAALYGDVDVLVSGDADLLALSGRMVRPRILTAVEFLAELGASREE